MKTIHIATTVLVLMFTLAQAQTRPLFAQDEKDRKAPLEVTSERMVSSKKNNIISFFGSVVAIKGKLRVEADEIHVTTGKDKGEFKKIEAKGAVKIMNNGKVATGEKADYYPDKREIILTGNTTLTSDNDKAFGDRVVYNLDTEDMKIDGSARAIFYQEGKAAKDKTPQKKRPKPVLKKKPHPPKIKKKQAKAPEAVPANEPEIDDTDSFENDDTEHVVNDPVANEYAVSKEKTPGSAASIGRAFTLQVGSFRKKVEAINLSVLLKNKGYDVYMKEFDNKGSRWYRVRVGKFKTKSAAKRVGEKLKKKEHLPALLVPIR